MKIQTRNKVRTVALCVLSLLVLAGCSSGDRRSPVEAILAIDVSYSAKDQLLKYAKAVYGAEHRLPAGSRLRVYVFGHGADLVYTGPCIAGRDEFNRKIGSAIASPPAHLLTPGTQTDRLLEKISGDAEGPLPVVILIATDGGMEDQSAGAMGRLSIAVEALGNSRGLKALALVGVASQFRTQWEGWLAPLGTKASVRGECDLGDGIDRLLALGGAK